MNMHREGLKDNPAAHFSQQITSFPVRATPGAELGSRIGWGRHAGVSTHACIRRVGRRRDADP